MESQVDLKSTSDDPVLGIGQAGQRFGVAAHVLRHWESMGLLSPERTRDGHRRYHRADLIRIAVILRAKDAGLSLDAIHHMITCDDPGTRQQALQHQRDALAERIARQQAALALLDCALTCSHRDVATCPHFQQMIAQRAGLA
ncbi:MULTISPECIES: MerR family transcriptional regulator [unclassified Actinoplanes]|uniref:helix-turn-helix domain-containing protein n=1 Tax=unclassified Actinoplanes TaxID=2626549 RepID=UPI0002F16D43|nr:MULTISPECIES: MerR family transcriptional regulator [unclassified Actinoplanes]